MAVDISEDTLPPEGETWRVKIPLLSADFTVSFAEFGQIQNIGNAQQHEIQTFSAKHNQGSTRTHCPASLRQAIWSAN